jgi:hypothetical protein
MEWYDRQFWETDVWLESTLKIDSKGMKWLDVKGVGEDDR